MDIERNIEDIIENNMMDFSQYVIKHRALPDLYSGMKPIHSKILWSMYENKTFNFTKSANVSGKVTVYSPHGDCYETIVNMVQKDRHIYNLVLGRGNWGSNCSTELHYSASRYTECMLSPLGIDCLKGIEENQVEMIDNYDNSKIMPKYIPTRFPLILCMASNGIAVGMANNSPSFNLKDVCEATILHLEGKEIPILYPDFASGAYLIDNTEQIVNINKNGLGVIKLRAKYEVIDNTIKITEIPYGSKINIEMIIDKIIEKCKSGELKEITNVLNHTGIDGLCIEITFKKNTDVNLLMKKLFKLTALESNFNANMNVLVKGTPKILGVHDTIKEWCIFRQECIKKGLSYKIDNLKKELNLLYGLKKVLLDIDKAIELIRFSDNVENELMDYFKIDRTQSEYIINIKLKNINKDYIIKQIKDIEKIELELENSQATLKDTKLINELIIQELKDIIKKFSKPRRTQIIKEENDIQINKEDLIEDYNCKIVYTKGQYIKKLNRSVPFETHKLKDDDTILEEIESNNKETLIFITNKANRYKLQCHELDICNSPSKALGEYFPNILPLEEGEEILRVISIDEKKSKGFVCCVFENGKISKVAIKAFISSNKKLQNCYSTESKLLDVYYFEKDVDILLVSNEGKGLIVNTEKLGSVKSSKITQGNNSMKLDDENKVVFTVMNPSNDLYFTIHTDRDKTKEIRLDDIAESSQQEKTWYNHLKSNPNCKGNFIYNTRTKNDNIISIQKH